MTEDKMSRRRFLTYVIGGTAGFLGAGMIFPMVRYATAPTFQNKKQSKFFPTNAPVTEITDTPKSFSFEALIEDGWYKPQKPVLQTAWVYRNSPSDKDIIALSPVCKHLGCTVMFDGNPQYKNEFFCPCHFGRYYKDGVNVPGTPPVKPLDKFETRVVDGKLEIGPIIKV